MASPPRRALMILTAYLAISMTFLEGAAFQSMAIPIRDEFGLSLDAMSTIVVFPELAGFVLVFGAGALAYRLGRRLVMAGASTTFAVGAILLALAPGAGVLTIARVLLGAGTVTMAVVGLSLINVLFASSRSRGRAFGVAAAVNPVIAVVMPNVSAYLAENVSWRIVPLIWLVAAVLLFVLSVLCLPHQPSGEARVELLTPLLAGVALASLSLASTSLTPPGTLTAIALATGVAASAALIVALRRTTTPGLDLSAFRSAGGIRAGLVIVLVWCVSLTTYINLFVQFRYNLTAVTSALLLTICEIAGVVGALAFGHIASRIGAQRAALIALTSGAVLGIGLIMVAGASSPWLIITVTALVSVANIGAIGPITEYFLDRADKSASDSTSSIADALSNIGYVAGGSIVSIVVFSSFAMSMTNLLQERGYPPERAQAIAADLRGGTFAQDLVARDGASDPQLQKVLIDDPTALDTSQSDAVRVLGVCFSITFGGAALLMLPGIRRRASLHGAPAEPLPDR